MKSPRKGFTLIELLVVIAIIAILAAILFPVFAQARAKARQTVCLSNCKQMAYGMLMYKQDYDDRWIDIVPGFNEFGMGDLPKTPSNPPNPLSDFGPPWCYQFNGNRTKHYLLEGYLKNQDVQTCPTLHTIPVAGQPTKYPMYALNGVIGSLNVTQPDPNYPTAPDYNPYNPKPAPYGQWPRNGPWGRNDAMITHGSDFVIMWEHNNGFMWCEHWPSQNTLLANPVGEQDVYGLQHWGAIHSKGFNASFADGHAKMFQASQLKIQNVCYWTLPTTP